MAVASERHQKQRKPGLWKFNTKGESHQHPSSSGTAEALTPPGSSTYQQTLPKQLSRVHIYLTEEG